MRCSWARCLAEATHRCVLCGEEVCKAHGLKHAEGYVKRREAECARQTAVQCAADAGPAAIGEIPPGTPSDEQGA